MKTMQAAGLAALGMILSGCATIVNGTTQSISISTASVVGARCTLVNSEGTWYVTTPGSAVVHKTKNDLDITCTMAGYEDAHRVVPSKFNATTAGNIIAGGLVGIAVDAASGANYEYPAETVIEMKPVGASASDAPAEQPSDTGAAEQPAS